MYVFLFFAGFSSSVLSLSEEGTTVVLHLVSSLGHGCVSLELRQQALVRRLKGVLRGTYGCVAHGRLTEATTAIVRLTTHDDLHLALVQEVHG